MYNHEKHLYLTYNILNCDNTGLARYNFNSAFVPQYLSVFGNTIVAPFVFMMLGNLRYCQIEVLMLVGK